MGTFAETKEKFYKNLNKVDCTFEEWLKANPNVMHHHIDLQLFIKYQKEEDYSTVNNKKVLEILLLISLKSMQT